MIELVKIKDKSNNAIIEVKKSLAGDFIGTGKYVAVLEDKKEETVIEKPKFSINKSNKDLEK